MPRLRALAVFSLVIGVRLLVPATAHAMEPEMAVADRGSSDYRLRASVRVDSAEIEGQVQIHFRNSTSGALDHLVLVLFPNRFADEKHDSGINDFNRPFVYPYQDFDPGWMKLARVTVAGQVVPSRGRSVTGVVDGTFVEVPLDRRLSPGEAVDLVVDFTTRLPNRFGSFGHFDDQITAIGGWYPFVASTESDMWLWDGPPPAAHFDVELSFDQPRELVLNGRLSNGPVSRFSSRIQDVRYLSLVAAPAFEREDIGVGRNRAVLLYRDPGWWHSRIALGPSHAEIRREAILAGLGETTPSADPIVVVEAPLRMHLTAPGEGMVVMSDRALRAHWLLRGFHQLQVSAAIKREMLRSRLQRREPDRDLKWVSEGLGFALAKKDIVAAPLPGRSVQDWIELFNIFAVVDRFETAPKIPFVEAFFAKVPLTDPLHEQILTYNNSLAPGEVLFEKLRQRLGDARFDRVISACSSAEQPFRACAVSHDADRLGAGVSSAGSTDQFFREWLGPLPRVNYRVAGRSFNQPQGDGYLQQVDIERQSERSVSEPVEIGFESSGDDAVVGRWDGSGNRGRVEVRTNEPVERVILDPERRLIETTRVDNGSPPVRQLVLDTAEIEVSSTEFSLAGTLVARTRYDYRKDLALTAFYTNRNVGLTVGPRYHWGAQNDENSYRHNLYAFYGFQWLDSDFDDHSRPGLHTDGHVNGVGLRYDYNNIFAYDNPTSSNHIRLFSDIWHAALGSDYDFADWGWSASFTRPLWSYRTLIAADAFNGFSTAIGDSSVPNQSRFSLGGSRSIRGIGAEEKLGRNIFVLRGELRQAIYPEFDHNLMDFLILRRGQVHVFGDAGEVDSSAGDIYDPRRWAVGVGVGIGTVYEFMGLYPATMYLEIATRVDRKDDLGEIQVLFGTRQAF